SQSGDERVKSSKGSRKNKTSEGGEILYCFCREPEGSRFMIGCDSCDEWYHGTCVGITKSEGKGIESYYCEKCIAAHPKLKIVFKEPKDGDPNSIPQRCRDCIQCCTLPDCGTCSRCKAKNGRCLKVECMYASHEMPKAEKKPKTVPKAEPKTEPKTEPKEEPEEPKEVEEDDDTYFLPSTSRKTGGGGVVGSTKQGPAKGRRKPGKKEKEKGVAKRGGKERNTRTAIESSLGDRLIEGSEAYYAHLEKQRKEYQSRHGPMQCFGVNCSIEARPNSKYCSDECGMRRAKERIAKYLPKGVESYWKIEPVAVRQNREEEISKEQQKEELKKEKADLDKCHGLVVDYVRALKPFGPDDKEDSKADGDFVVACPVCTVEFGCKVIAKHTERCFARSEKQATYGTSVKCPVNPDGIFCDQFNKSNNSYCRRLRVICPEHYKGDIEEGVEVCGYPRAWFKSESTTLERLFTSVDEIIGQGFCGISRKDCKKHCGWMTLILGLIDNRRLNYFQRMEELAEKKNVKSGDALLLMSNQTEYHQPLEKILEMYEEGVKNGGETVLATLL
ncbi:hypothetical protein PMAYCL1PPCAC_02273, partial [Pristionchus mayeri]